MRQKIVAGNWKMNTDRASGLALIEALIAEIGGSSFGCEVVVCPPFVVLDAASQRIAGSVLKLGAQDVFHESHGAYTGEISTAMLLSVGCTHVIIGHSERRTHFGESDDIVARKTAAAIASGIVPIVCVGETLDEREAGSVDDVIGRQIDGAIGSVSVSDGVLPLVIAYEPVWAIGTGVTASPEQAQDVHAFIRSRVEALHGASPAGAVRILYGGSVTASNASELFGQNDIDGGLIGGASLKADSFGTIVRAADRRHS